MNRDSFCFFSTKQCFFHDFWNDSIIRDSRMNLPRNTQKTAIHQETKYS